MRGSEARSRQCEARRRPCGETRNGGATEDAAAGPGTQRRCDGEYSGRAEDAAAPTARGALLPSDRVLEIRQLRIERPREGRTRGAPPNIARKPAVIDDGPDNHPQHR